MWLWLFFKGLDMILDKEGVGEGRNGRVSGMWLWLNVKGLVMILDKEGVGEEWEGVWDVSMAICEVFGHDFG